MATKFYLTGRAAPYTPATIRGAWDDTAGAVTRALDQSPGRSGLQTTVARAETNASTTYDVLLYRGVSGPLAAATIGGTVDVVIGVLESNADADDNWHVHIYATQGDSDTPRGTLLTDYLETAGVNEWSATAATCGKALTAAQSLSSVAISDGDRIVVEIGYIARNNFTTSRTGTLYYGTEYATTGGNMPDLAASGDPTLGRGFITFSDTLASYLTSDPARATQAAAEVVRDGTSSVRIGRVTQAAAEVVRDGTAASARSVRMTQMAVEVLFDFVPEVVQPRRIPGPVPREPPPQAPPPRGDWYRRRPRGPLQGSRIKRQFPKVPPREPRPWEVW